MNKGILIICILSLLSLTSCKDEKMQAALTSITEELETLKRENSDLLAQIKKQDRNANRTNHLIHYVFLDVKDEISEKQFQYLLKEIKTLGDIPGVNDFEVGRFEDMEDENTLSNREINFEMRFQKKTNYYAYQKSAEHIRVRELLSPFLAKPPVTYDYLVQ